MNRERSERGKKWEILAFWAYKNHRSAAVRRGARRVRPPLDPLVAFNNYLSQQTVIDSLFQ